MKMPRRIALAAVTAACAAMACGGPSAPERVERMGEALASSLTGPLSPGYTFPNMQPLPGGGFLALGSPTSAVAQRYDPAANAWTQTGAYSVARDSFDSVALLDGRVLVSGGITSSNAR